MHRLSTYTISVLATFSHPTSGTLHGFAPALHEYWTRSLDQSTSSICLRSFRCNQEHRARPSYCQGFKGSMWLPSRVPEHPVSKPSSDTEERGEERDSTVIHEYGTRMISPAHVRGRRLCNERSPLSVHALTSHLE